MVNNRKITLEYNIDSIQELYRNLPQIKDEISESEADKIIELIDHEDLYQLLDDYINNNLEDWLHKVRFGKWD